MSGIVQLAFWFHSALCAGFLGFALVGSARGLARSPVAACTSGTMRWGEEDLSPLFYLVGALYLIYAEIYLYRLTVLAALPGG